MPYAIDFMNPAPDADVHSVGQANFDWIVNAVAELAVKKAIEPRAPATYRWERSSKATAALKWRALLAHDYWRPL